MVNLEHSYLDELSEVQREAVTATEGPSLVIAGAGSGKTRVLTYRIAHLLRQGVPPWSILALTFTNKAAREMKERIASVVGDDVAKMLWMGTFHSVFARILRKEAALLGFSSTFTIYDTADSKNLIRLIVRDLQLDPKVYKDGAVHARISMAKNNLVTAQAYANNSRITIEDAKQHRSEIHRIYSLYQQRCFRSSAMDFDDILLNTNILFRDFPDVLARYQQKFRYLLVDEYQDTNYAQYLIVKKLAEQHHNLCVVGDDAQSIYSFRGAKIENILNFRNDYAGYKLFKLEQNYRSTQTIVNVANSIIDKNKNQIKKVSFSANDIGDRVKLLTAFTDKEEAFMVGAEISDILHSERCQYSDFAILYRTNAQSRSFEETLRKLNIPYRVYGTLSFYQRKEIKDLLAYFRLVANPNDDEALLRIINYPARGIGETSIAHLRSLAQAKDMSLWSTIAKLPNSAGELKPAAVGKIMGFAKIVGNLQTAVHTGDAYEMAGAIASTSGIIADLKNDKSLEGLSRLQNVEELLNSIKDFVEQRRSEGETEVITLTDYLENVALLTDFDNDDKDDRNRVSVMTIHASKGLEFDYVFLVGLEENLFPPMQLSMSPYDLEEERRLFYVAITRAAKRITISHARTRLKWGQMVSNSPSRFLSDIDPQFIDTDEMVTERKSMIAQPQTRWRQSPATGTPSRNLTRIDASTTPADESRHPSTDTSIAVGMQVSHDRFGAGEVLAVEGEGANRAAIINFYGAGQKKLLLKFAKLKVER